MLCDVALFLHNNNSNLNLLLWQIFTFYFPWRNCGFLIVRRISQILSGAFDSWSVEDINGSAILIALEAWSSSLPCSSPLVCSSSFSLHTCISVPFTFFLIILSSPVSPSLFSILLFSLYSFHMASPFFHSIFLSFLSFSSFSKSHVAVSFFFHRHTHPTISLIRLVHFSFLTNIFLFHLPVFSSLFSSSSVNPDVSENTSYCSPVLYLFKKLIRTQPVSLPCQCSYLPLWTLPDRTISLCLASLQAKFSNWHSSVELFFFFSSSLESVFALRRKKNLVRTILSSQFQSSVYLWIFFFRECWEVGRDVIFKFIFLIVYECSVMQLS